MGVLWEFPFELYIVPKFRLSSASVCRCRGSYHASPHIDFIVIKSSKKTQLQFVNCRAHATHRNAVSQAFGSNWKQNSWVDVGLPKFTCATFNGVGRIGTFPNCTHFNNSISQKLVSYLFWFSDTLCFELGRG